MSFDYDKRGSPFGYELTRHFGDSEDSSPPLPMRIHVTLLDSHGPASLGTVVLFSFPLCGCSQEDWSHDEAMRFLSRQIIEFSHHLGNTECTDLLGVFWGLAKFTFLESLPGSRERHLLMYMIVDSRLSPCYMYIHEDALPVTEARGLAMAVWRQVCCTLSERLVGSRGRQDWDYSPSKPASKIARLAARAASFLAPSP